MEQVISSPASLATGRTSRRLSIVAPREIVLEDDTTDRPMGSAEVVVESLVSGISHGTEMAWYRGQAPALWKSWDPTRRIYLTGVGRQYPVRPGYETVGRVVDAGADVSELRIGDLVHIDRPHGDRHVVPSAEAARHPLPQDLDPERAVFLALARVALGGIHDGRPLVGETVLVTGLGTVGLLTVQLARLAGVRRVVGVDRYPVRLQAARGMGAEVVNALEVGDVAVAVREAIGAEGADLAIEASGSYRLLNEAIRGCRVGGRVVTVASYHEQHEGLALGEEYHRNRITLISSMTVNGCSQRSHPAWDLDRLNTTALELISTGRLATADLVTHRFAFEDAQAAYELIDRAPESTIKVVLTYARP